MTRLRTLAGTTALLFSVAAITGFPVHGAPQTPIQPTAQPAGRATSKPSRQGADKPANETHVGSPTDPASGPPPGLDSPSVGESTAGGSKAAVGAAPGPVADATAPVAGVHDSAGAHDFDSKVRPILAQNCYKCHTDEQAGGLQMDTRAALLKGGDSGPSIIPGSPDKSLLIQAVQQTGDLKMPPKGKKLTDGEIAALVDWVKSGAAIPADAAAKPVVATLTSADASTPAASEFFETRIRPVFANECGECHQSGQAAGLQITSRDSLLKGGNSGPALVPGDPDKSLLIQAVRQSGHLKMPKGGKLSDAQVADLVTWVKMGAPWPAATVPVRARGKQITPEMRNFWSFQPLHDFPVPQTKSPWVRDDIDHFVLARLEAKGLKPSAEADRRTLLRRATLDLTGVPPTPEEVTAFENDHSKDAYEKVVDRLLASPRYGERWGRHWLDVARYADDDIRGLDPRGRGYMPLDGAWTYRDWVIKAFNTDLPYDQFVHMQLAGDLLQKNPTHDQLTATSFLGGAPWIWDQAEPVQGRADERNERIDAVSRGMLGLTVACARCHDHKYDPILAKDYYALGGVFANATYKEYALVPDAEVNFWRTRFAQQNKLDDSMRDYTKTAARQLAVALSAQTSNYMVAAWRVTGKPKLKLEQAADQDKLDPEMLERWVHFLGEKQSFFPYLHDWQNMIAQGGTEDQARFLGDSFQHRISDLLLEANALDKENEKIKAKAGVPTEREKDVLPSDFDTYDQFCPGCTLELKVMPTEKANLYTALFLRSLSEDPDDEFGKPGLFVFRGWGLRRRLGVAEQAYLTEQEAALKKLHTSLPQEYPFVHGMADKPKLQNIALNLRGNPHNLGDEVPRGFLTVLRSPDEKPYTRDSGRLELADDIVRSPIASRVIVNRIWKWHFGTGIVNTPDNFGAVGDPPSDPELLDYLALQLHKNNWSLKKLQREIMLSATYRQGSVASPEAQQLDPNNRLYSHFSIQRLDAEQLRDSLLFVAGDMDAKEGGPAVPLGISNHRRTVYAKVSRFRIDSFLQAFDFPNPTFTSEQRFSTNVPVQRLFFMNNSFVYAQAGKLAERVFPDADDTARIKQTYSLLFGRQPTPDELQLGLNFLKSTPEKPGYLVNQEPDTAWKQYARALFSSNEFEFLH